MISIHIFIIKYQCHCRIIHYVDTFDHISRYSGSFNLTGYKSFIFCISYRYKGISIYSFLLPSALRITIPSWFTGVFPLPNHSRIFGLNVILQILASDKVILHLSLFSAHLQARIANDLH